MHPPAVPFLGAGLAGVAAAGLTACESEAPSADSSPGPGVSTSPAGAGSPTTLAVPDFDPADWESVRAQFPLDAAMAQFAAFVLSPHTAQVDAAVDYHRQRLAFDTEQTLLEGITLEDTVRQAAADYAGGAPGDYALTDSTTMGIALMYGGLSLRPGDEVLTTTHDFYSTEDSLRLLEQRTGAKVRRVSLYDNPWEATVDEMVSRLEAGLTARTKVVAVTWVHSSTGVRLPIEEISMAIGGRALLCVDGVHGLRRRRRRPARPRLRLPRSRHPQVAVRPARHRHPLGPQLRAADRADPVVLRVREWRPPLPRRLPLLRAPVGPGPGVRLPPADRPGGGRPAHRRPGDAAQGGTGSDQRSSRSSRPLDPEVSAGIVCLDIPGLMPGNGVFSLREAGIVASATPYHTSYLRLGPSIVTTPEQVDAAVEAVAALV